MQLLLFISESVLLKLAKKTKTNIDDLLVEKTRIPLAILIMLIGARLAAEALQFTEYINNIITKVITSLIVLTISHVVVVIFNVIIDNWGRKIVAKTESDLDDQLLIIFHRFTKIVLYILGFMYVLTIWGVQIAPLLASLGIAGLAVALALQSTLSNIFGGISIILDQAVKIGDIVQLEDGTKGRVVKVSLRSTKIVTFDNELITIPNGKLADSKIMDWHQPDKRIRITIKFGVEYGSDANKVKKVVLDLIKKEDKILKEPAPLVLFDEMADFSLNFSAYFWIENVDDKITVKDIMTTKIYNALRKNKIGIPFPTRTVYIKKEE